VLFLVALAVAVALADLSPLLIAGVMLVGWVIVALLEWAAWRDEPHYASGLPPRYYVPPVSLPPRQPLEQVAAYPSAEQRDEAPTWIASAALRAEVLGAWPVAPVSAGEDTQAEEPQEPVAEVVPGVVADPEPEVVAEPEPEVAAAEAELEPEPELEAEPEPVVAAALDDDVVEVEAVGAAEDAEPRQEAEPAPEPDPEREPEPELGGEPEPFVAAALAGAVAGIEADGALGEADVERDAASTAPRRRWFWQRRRDTALDADTAIDPFYASAEAELEPAQAETPNSEPEEDAELEAPPEPALEAEPELDAEPALDQEPEPEQEPAPVPAPALDAEPALEPEPEPEVVPTPADAAEPDEVPELTGEQTLEPEPEPELEPEPEPAPVLALVPAPPRGARHRLDPLAEPEARRWPWQRQAVDDHSVADVPARPTGVRVLPGTSRRRDA
jgi:pilus assembly protein FimV